LGFTWSQVAISGSLALTELRSKEQAKAKENANNANNRNERKEKLSN
jgi:hypothetical protein